MIPKVIYLKPTAFDVLPFDKSEERMHAYINVDLLKDWIQKNVFKIFVGGMHINPYIPYDELLGFIQEEEQK